jgi:hypothetical protein
LRQEVRRIGLRANLIGYEALGLAIARIVRVLPDAVEEIDQQLAFLGRHLSLHQRNARAFRQQFRGKSRAYGPLGRALKLSG